MVEHGFESLSFLVSYFLGSLGGAMDVIVEACEERLLECYSKLEVCDYNALT